jgi:putative transposase
MPPKRCTEEQILAVLKEADAGMPTQEIIRTHGIGADTFYRWKRRYGGLQPSELHRLRALEDENRRLKRLVPDRALNLQVLKDLLGKRS